MAATSLTIERREHVLDGRSFGAAGGYEKIAGVLRFAVDPALPLHGQITDIGLAPRNAAGLVEFAGDFFALQPLDPARGNRRLLLDVPNRGRKIALGMFNGTPWTPDPSLPEHFGNGFLMRHGYTMAWIGWQPDVPRRDGLMALDVPAARGASGRLTCEWRPNVAADVLPLADRYHLPHPVADLDDPSAELTARAHGGAAAVAIPRARWRFSRRDGGALVPDGRHVHLEGGFEPGVIYACHYRSADPAVVGLGLLAVRDTAAFLRWGGADRGNPCAGRLDRAYVFGVSQTGRFLRHLLYLGLDATEDGRSAFDAVVPHVAGARRGEFNMRFGQPSLSGPESAGSLFPFTDREQVDPLTGERDGLLARVAARRDPPRVMAINSSAEYWRGDASLCHTDVEGRHDVEPAPFARMYLFAGTQHTPGALPPLTADPNTGGRGSAPFSVVDYAPLLRAALVNLDRWVTAGIEPPPSAVPRLADGTAVPAAQAAAALRRLPGVRVPDRERPPARLDFGPEWPRGIAAVPPKVGAPYVSYVPSLDGDGNEVPGIRPPELLAPLGTYTGWNLRHPEQGAPGDLMSMMGATRPFPLTRAAREALGDPRPSLEERYGSRKAYLDQLRDALAAAVAARHVLAEDVDAIIDRAGRLWDLLQKGLTTA